MPDRKRENEQQPRQRTSTGKGGRVVGGQIPGGLRFYAKEPGELWKGFEQGSDMIRPGCCQGVGGSAWRRETRAAMICFGPWGPSSVPWGPPFRTHLSKLLPPAGFLPQAVGGLCSPETGGRIWEWGACF